MAHRILSIVSIVLLLYVANIGLHRTPAFAFWKSGKAFSIGLLYYSENILVNLEEFHGRCVASIKAYKERKNSDEMRSSKQANTTDDVLTKMTAAEAFSTSCLSLAAEQRDLYDRFTRQKFVFNRVLIPSPEKENSSSSTGTFK